ncbi:MAG: restriction endonuclease [Bacteroidetes bacterium QH_8_67_23]|jgi:hypothetical protein|nr:MAG: restriction endonuclease [Bacteroidetes bacterium QH_8_67_23]
MDFAEQIEALAARVEGQLEGIQTEEATKNALVMPFLQALGYNVFDPSEVVPEFTSDYGTKQGEKVDYAVFQDGDPIMLFECKTVGAGLSTNHASQLYRYFSVTPARIGVLTDGQQYRFFSDLEEENKMDDRPFLEFDLFERRKAHVEELKKLRRSAFNLDEALSAAHDLKYLKALRQYFQRQWDEPEEEFVRFMAGRVYDGRITKNVRAALRPVIRKALRQFVHGRVSGRLKSALHAEEASSEEGEREEPQEEDKEEDASDGIVTTDEEMKGFHIVRAIMAEVIDPKRVVDRDVKSYFGILLDDNNRKPICRLHFNTSQKYIELFDEGEGERLPIDELDEIYQYADRLQSTPARHE